MLSVAPPASVIDARSVTDAPIVRPEAAANVAAPVGDDDAATNAGWFRRGTGNERPNLGIT